MQVADSTAVENKQLVDWFNMVKSSPESIKLFLYCFFISILSDDFCESPLMKFINYNGSGEDSQGRAAGMRTKYLSNKIEKQRKSNTN